MGIALGASSSVTDGKSGPENILLPLITSSPSFHLGVPEVEASSTYECSNGFEYRAASGMRMLEGGSNGSTEESRLTREDGAS